MAETDKDDLISIIEENDKDATLPDTLPLLPIRDIVIFNDMLMDLLRFFRLVIVPIGIADTAQDDGNGRDIRKEINRSQQSVPCFGKFAGLIIAVTEINQQIRGLINRCGIRFHKADKYPL